MAGRIESISLVGNGEALITTMACVVCGEKSNMLVDAKAFEKWQAGTHIQHAFPDMSADQREILISGTHGKCWNILFPPEEDDE